MKQNIKEKPYYFRCIGYCISHKVLPNTQKWYGLTNIPIFTMNVNGNNLGSSTLYLLNENNYDHYI